MNVDDVIKAGNAKLGHQSTGKAEVATSKQLMLSWDTFITADDMTNRLWAAHFCGVRCQSRMQFWYCSL
eukprot:scaffold79356_cov22-Tisochrysis_lutea.AAC.2